MTQVALPTIGLYYCFQLFLKYLKKVIHNHGFRPQHCIEHAALHFHNDLLQRLDSSKTPFAKFLDLFKAFLKLTIKS